MRKACLFLLYCALVSQVHAQTYWAKNATSSREVAVPKALVRKIEQKFSNAQIDSCFVYGNEENPERDFVFFIKQRNRTVNLTFHINGKLIKAKIETAISELPQRLQKLIADESAKGNNIDKAFKIVIWRQKGKWTRYMVMWFENWQGVRIKVPVYYSKSGHKIIRTTPGFH